MSVQNPKQYPPKELHVRTAVSFPHVYRLCEQLVRDGHPEKA